VRQQLVLMPGGAPYVAPLKTPASYRTVPLPRVVIDALTAHLAAFPASTVELLDATVKPNAKLRPAVLVFTDDAGRALRRTRFSRIWRQLRQRRDEDRTREAVDAVLGRQVDASEQAAP
jgi:hypothetical protein